jgi:hypothetical protein
MSTFYTNVYIDEKAADILIKGLSEPKSPPPKRGREEKERCEQIAAQFLSNLDRPKASSNA